MDSEHLPYNKFDIDFSPNAFKTVDKNHYKMLADVIEALLGAVFLDSIPNPDDDEHISADYNNMQVIKQLKEVEGVWDRLIKPYLEIYVDDS